MGAGAPYYIFQEGGISELYLQKKFPPPLRKNIKLRLEFLAVNFSTFFKNQNFRANFFEGGGGQTSIFQGGGTSPNF